MKSSGILALAILLAGCATPAAPPLPPPPPFALQNDQPLPDPDQDQKLIRDYETKSGFTYSAEQNRLSLLSLFARRAEHAHLAGYSMVWADKGRVFVNMKPPFDRVATLNLAAPELRPVVQIRAVRFAAGEIQPIIEQLATAIAPLKASAAISYNPQTDRFDIGIEADKIAQALALVPIDLAPYTDVFEGGVTLVHAQSSDPVRI